jgi:hypothetical protein
MQSFKISAAHKFENYVFFFFSEIRASWEEWWTYDGISGKMSYFFMI